MTVFAEVPPVRYEGPDTANEFAYRAYDKDRLVLGKRMEEWLRPAVVQAGELERLRSERYLGWSSDLGRSIESGEFTLGALADHALELQLDPQPRSGRQELAESLVARRCGP